MKTLGMLISPRESIPRVLPFTLQPLYHAVRVNQFQLTATSVVSFRVEALE
jgi:hypothetical protein